MVEESAATEALVFSPPATPTLLLTVKSFLDYICDDFTQSPIYLPLNCVSPSEEIDGMALRDERMFRLFACELI